MNCQDCGTLLPTDQTIRGLDVDARTHTCKCGSRFMSEQRIVRRLLSAPSARPSNTHKHPPNRGNAPPIDGANPRASVRGVGGGLPSGSDPESDPNPGSLGDPERARARSTYHAEFERAWESTDKTGSKWKAQAAWERAGKPSADVVRASWAKWKQLDGWRRGFVPHVLTWLNGRCFEQEPREAERKQPALTSVPPAVRDEQQRRSRRVDAMAKLAFGGDQ